MQKSYNITALSDERTVLNRAEDFPLWKKYMRRSAKEYGKCEDILQGIKVIFKYPSIPGSKKSKAAAAGEEDDTIAMFQ